MINATNVVSREYCILFRKFLKKSAYGTEEGKQFKHLLLLDVQLSFSSKHNKFYLNRHYPLFVNDRITINLNLSKVMNCDNEFCK